MATSFATFDELRAASGRHLGWTEWVDLTQERVDLFAGATGDGDDGRVPPFLVLALTNLFLPQLLAVPAASTGVNYGTGAVRFPTPVPVGGRVRGGAELTVVEDIPAGLQTTITITVEVDGPGEPACVVESMSRWLP